MKTKCMLALLLTLGLIGTATLVARAEDKDEENEKVTSLDKIPAAAKEAIVKEVGSNTIDKVLEGKKGDNTYYEAQYKDGGKKMEVKVDASGKVLKKGEADDDDDDKGKDKDKDKK